MLGNWTSLNDNISNDFRPVATIVSILVIVFAGAPGNLLALPVEARKLTSSVHMYALALALALPHVVICIKI